MKNWAWKRLSNMPKVTVARWLGKALVRYLSLRNPHPVPFQFQSSRIPFTHRTPLLLPSRHFPGPSAQPSFCLQKGLCSPVTPVRVGALGAGSWSASSLTWGIAQNSPHCGNVRSLFKEQLSPLILNWDKWFLLLQESAQHWAVSRLARSPTLDNT